MAKVFVSGWVERAEVLRGGVLRLRLHEWTWDVKAREKRRKVWTIIAFGAAALEPYLEKGHYISCVGDFDLVQKGDKAYRQVVRAEIALGPRARPDEEQALPPEKARGLPEDLTPKGEFYEDPEDWVEGEVAPD